MKREDKGKIVAAAPATNRPEIARKSSAEQGTTVICEYSCRRSWRRSPQQREKEAVRLSKGYKKNSARSIHVAKEKNLQIQSQPNNNDRNQRDNLIAADSDNGTLV